MSTMPPRRPLPRPLHLSVPRRGVSLVEALVALAIMSFGMLALVGVQATLRHNSDAARERTEAMRLAAQDAESLRAFGSLDQTLVASVVPWDQLDVRAGVPVTLPVTTGVTTSYTLDRQRSIVHDRVAGSTRFEGVDLKVFEVRVSWADRIGNNYAAVLDSAVVAADPALSARVVMPVPTSVPSRVGTRHASIPVSARDLGNGSSALKPFNQGTVAYVLDNATGYVTSLCTGVVASQSAITLSDVSGSGCSTVLGRLLTGTVRYHFVSPVDAAAAENPLGPTVLPLDQAAPLGFATSGTGIPVNHAGAPVCYADNPASPADAGSSASPRSRIDYICVMFPDSALGWGGQINILPGSSFPDGSASNWSLGATGSTYRVCRYTTASTTWTANIDHPKVYCKVNSTGLCDTGTNSRDLVRQNLSHQNFLVLRGNQSCPTDVAANPSAGDLVNSNTLPHQP